MSQVVASKFDSERTFSLYLITWVCLALASLGYIAVALARPDLLSDSRMPGVLGHPAHGTPDASASQAAVIERGLSEIRAQLTDIQLKVMRGELREQELAARISSIESRIDELSTGSAPQSANKPVAALPVPAAEKATDKGERARVAATQPAPKSVAPPVRAAEADAVEADAARSTPKQKGTSPVETASVRREVQPFGAPEVKVERQERAAEKSEDALVGIQLGGAPSLDSLRLNWTILSDRHADALGSLQPRYVTSDALGTTSFNLVAGPVASRTEAIRVCAKLRAQGVTCRLTAFQGSAL